MLLVKNVLAVKGCIENEIVPAFSQKVKQIDYVFGLATFTL